MSNNYTLLQGLKRLNRCQPDSSWTKTNKQVLLSYFDNNFSKTSYFSQFSFSLKLRPVFATFIFLGIIFSTGVGTIYAAKGSLPGQPLYPVKRLAERVRLAIVASPVEKNVLRAELLTERVSEAQVLAYRVQQSDSDIKAEQKLVDVMKDIKSEISVLQKEIKAQVSELAMSPAPELSALPSENIVASLPIEDGKKIANLILSEEVAKSLAETKDLLAQKNLSTALDKTVELDKKLNSLANESSDSSSASVSPVTPSIVPSNSSTFNSIPTIQTPSESVIKPTPKKTAPPPAPISAPTDFNSLMILEKPIQADLIREP